MEANLEEKSTSKLEMSIGMNVLWKRFQSLNVIKKVTLMSKVYKLEFPYTISTWPPPDKIKIKSEVKKRKKWEEYDVYRNLSFFEHVDMARGSTNQSSQKLCKKSSQKSRKQPSQQSGKK